MCGCVTTAVWPDLAKFRHLGENFKIFGHFLRAKIVFGIILNMFWQIIYAIGEMLIVANDQILNM